MLRNRLIPVWMGILALSGMFLMGQDTWPPTCRDLDGDGYGVGEISSCTYPELDCDDTNADVNPGAVEGPVGDPICGDALDNNCDGFADEEDEGCGYTFPGGVYSFYITSIVQRPPGCVLNPLFVAILIPIFQSMDYLVDLPAYTHDPFLLTVPLPFMGEFYLEDSLFGNNEIIFSPQPESIDFGPLQLYMGMEGLNCMLTGELEGGITSLPEPPLMLEVDFSNLVVGLGSGEGLCTLVNNSPDPSCELIMTIEGTQ